MNKFNLENSLKVIGKDEQLRNIFLTFIKEVEKNLSYNGSVRDDITRYLVDSLFGKDDFVIKSCQDGTKYKFSTGIGSKVGREFLLSIPEIPEFAWEPQTTKLLLYLTKNVRNIVIGGAYFGEQALPLAKRIKEQSGIVHAFDLNEKQLSILDENLVFNDLKNVKIVHKGLWNDSKTFLNLSEMNDLAFATPSSDSKLSNTITIDEYVEENKMEGVDLIMLDIEGAELNVLIGAKNQLKKETGYPNVIFEIHSAYVDWSDGLDNTPIAKYLKSFGYTLYAIRDFQGNFDMRGKPIELIHPEDTVTDGPKHGFNMLAIKDKSLINNSMFKICKNVSPKYILHKDPAIHHHTDGF